MKAVRDSVVFKNSSLLDKADHLVGNDLEITFKRTGEVYTYMFVPVEIFEQFKNQEESAGKFFHSQIKKKYSYVKKEA